jgi:hypothetical protein
VKSRALNDLRLARLRLCKEVSEKLPGYLRDAIEACAQIVTERERFPELGSGRGQKRFRFTESFRERDLRRLEACAKVLMCIFSHLDLVRLRMGKPRRDGSCDAMYIARPRRREGRTYVDRWSQKTIEEETGLARSALFEALRDLRAAGYIDVHQPVKRYEDEATGEWKFRGMPAVITVSKLVFQRLGLDLAKLEEQRGFASTRERTEPEPLVDVRLARARQRVIREQKVLAAKSYRMSRQFETDQRDRLERLRRRFETEKKKE